MTETQKKKKDFERTMNFLEDLCWFLDSGKKNDYKEIAKLLENIKHPAPNTLALQLGQEPDELIGILQRLLTDKTLFNTNGTLAEFSSDVLGIQILNWHKRSRNEMIGVIICQVQEDDNVRDGISSYLLSNILKNKDKINKYRKETEESSNKFLWNDAIQRIIGDNLYE